MLKYYVEDSTDNMEVMYTEYKKFLINKVICVKKLTIMVKSPQFIGVFIYYVWYITHSMEAMYTECLKFLVCAQRSSNLILYFYSA